MSYPIELVFYVGKVWLPNEEFVDEKTSVVANGKEIWTTYDNQGIGLLCFELGANQTSFSPEFHLKSYENYCWDQKKDLIKLLRDLDGVKQSDPGIYHLLFIRDRSPEELNQGLFESIRKRVGLTLLEKSNKLKSYQRLNWVLIAGKRKAKGIKSNPGVKLPFGKHIASWNHKQHKPEESKDRGSGTFAILGQSLSTNCAEVRLKF